MGSSEKPVALVTGGTAGIGKAAVQAFIARGERVVFTGRREARGHALQHSIEEGGGEALFVAGDVGDERSSAEAVARALDTFGRLDHAFNNAGIRGDIGPFVDITEDQIDAILRTNVKGVLFSMKHQIPAMQRSGGGCIVNNASVSGLMSTYGVVPYSASKGAVVSMTRAVAHEVADLGIRINAVSPGGTYSEAFEQVFRHDRSAMDAFAQQYHHALKRIAQPEEIADVVLWLCSSASSFVTAQNIVVDGGMTTA